MLRNLKLLAVSMPALLVPLAPASADVIFTTGNQQYTNVDIQSATTADTVIGDIGNTGITMTFNTMIGPDGSTQIEMHCQNGVAFCQSAADSLPGATDTGFSSLTLTAEAGTGWTAGDFKLDELNGQANPGSVTFVGKDQMGNSTSQTFSLSTSGQNPFQFVAENGEIVTDIVMTVPLDSLLEDIKQVSLQAVPVPEPSSLILLGTGLLGLGLVRRRRRHDSV